MKLTGEIRGIADAEGIEFFGVADLAAAGDKDDIPDCGQDH